MNIHVTLILLAAHTSCGAFCRRAGDYSLPKRIELCQCCIANYSRQEAYAKQKHSFEPPTKAYGWYMHRSHECGGTGKGAA